MAYAAADLTQVVTIRREAQSPDGAGGVVTSWEDVRKEHALVRPMTGNERQAADRTEAIAGYLVVIRARNDVTEKDKIRWGERELNIRFVKAREPRSLFLELECDQGVAI